MIQIEAKPRQEIPLGRRGENEARQIIFDLADYISTYGPGTARLLHQRDGDPAPYIVPAVQDGDTLAWTVTDEDTAAPGTGSAELQWTVNNVLAKSDIWRTKTTVALDDGATAPPTGAEGWYQQLIAYIDSLRDEGVSEEQIASAVEAYLLEHPVDVPVESVNGQTGAVQLTAADVGALAQDDLQTGVDAALEQAKASGEFDGAPGDPGTDGITPTIGDNGNWYLGNTDTGKPSRGDTGQAGADGRDGSDGYSPTANVTQNDNGATITITDKNGTTTATVTSGKDGADGNPGADGRPGKDGADGRDGITPTIGSNGNWYLGTTDTGKPSRGATGAPGKDGAPGKGGHSPVVTATKSGRTTTISVDGAAIATVEDGADGKPGTAGADGVTPHIGDNGNWYLGDTDTGKPSRGEKGDEGQPGKDGQDGSPGKDGNDGQPGKDGTSPVISVSAITGGHRITITDANGTKTVDVMDGSDGKNGADGQPGADGSPGQDGQPGSDGLPGVDGADGVGIQSVEQTTTSAEDGGTNVVTVTKTDGTSSTFEVRNGSRGSSGPAGADGQPGPAGADGADGYTPVRGKDYWTAADQQAIVDDVLAALPTWGGGSY